MLPSNIAKLAAFALSALVATGCAASADGTTEAAAQATNDGTTSATTATTEALDIDLGPANFLSALDVVKMISTYRSYGTPVIGNGVLLTKIEESQVELDALAAAASRLQTTVTQTHANILGEPTITTLNSIAQLFRQYRTAAKISQAEVDLVLAGIRADTAKGGHLYWSDLDVLDNLLVGKDVNRGLLSVIAEMQASRGIEASANDVLGTYFVQMRLLQEEAFFLLAEADARTPGIDLTAKRAERDAMRRAQTDAFRAAMNEYYDRVSNKEVDDRAANVGECVCVDTRGTGLGEVCVMMAEDAEFAFADNNPAPKNGPGGGATGKSLCDSRRTDYLAQRKLEIKRELYGTVVANAKAFAAWPDAMTSDDASIKVLFASYGEAASGNSNDVGAQMANACNGKRECSFKVDNAALGDPNVQVTKILAAAYRCDQGTVMDPDYKSIRVVDAKDGTTVVLSCPAVTGSVDRLLGHFEDKAAAPQDGAPNPWAHVTVTKVSSSMVKWTNDAGVWWTLSLSPDATKLDVSASCAYYRSGYTKADVMLDASGNVTALGGPGGGIYSRVAQ